MERQEIQGPRADPTLNVRKKAAAPAVSITPLTPLTPLIGITATRRPARSSRRTPCGKLQIDIGGLCDKQPKQVEVGVSLDREGEAECRSFSDFRFDPDPAMIPLNNPLTNRQPDAGAGILIAVVQALE